VEEQTNDDLATASPVQHGKPGPAPDSKRKVKPSSVRRLSFHFELGFKKVVRCAPRHDAEARANGNDRNANPLPQVRMISGGNAAPAVPLAAAAQVQAFDDTVPAGDGGDGSSGSTTTTYSLFGGGDTTYTVSPPNSSIDPWGGKVQM
jgi:hypothetical protein